MPKRVAIGLKHEQLESTTGRAPCDVGSRERVLTHFLKNRSIWMQRYIANGKLSHNCSTGDSWLLALMTSFSFQKGCRCFSIPMHLMWLKRRWLCQWLVKGPRVDNELLHFSQWLFCSRYSSWPISTLSEGRLGLTFYNKGREFFALLQTLSKKACRPRANGSHIISVQKSTWDKKWLQMYYEGSNILPHLQAKKWNSHSFVDAGRRHKTPGPETKDFIIHGTANSMSVSVFASGPQARFPQGNAKRAKWYIHALGILSLGNLHLL